MNKIILKHGGMNIEWVIRKSSVLYGHIVWDEPLWAKGCYGTWKEATFEDWREFILHSGWKRKVTGINGQNL